MFPVCVIAYVCKTFGNIEKISYRTVTSRKWQRYQVTPSCDITDIKTDNLSSQLQRALLLLSLWTLFIIDIHEIPTVVWRWAKHKCIDDDWVPCSSPLLSRWTHPIQGKYQEQKFNLFHHYAIPWHKVCAELYMNQDTKAKKSRFGQEEWCDINKLWFAFVGKINLSQRFLVWLI